jgi:3-phenylpropionate/trans-cinnamate dioxygenase ferredoxin reductase subunit
MTGTVLIAGAGLAGSRTAETLRSLGHRGRIVVAGDEPHPPYERPALSKELLGATRDDVWLRPAGFWPEHGIEMLLDTAVTDVDRAERTALVGGEQTDWDALVLATGVRARRMSAPPGVHHLRTLDDALTLRNDLDERSNVVVVGAGFIGGEVASTLCGTVGSVTVIEPQSAPLERVLGPEIGGMLAARHRAHGIDLRLNTGVEEFIGGARVEQVRLTNGETIDADVVVVGIGSVGDAIKVDECGRTTTPGVYACGDTASWWRPSLGRNVRTEHWTSAVGQARAVASAIVGAPSPYDEPGFFWSDQFGLRLQHLGHADKWHAVVIEGDEEAFTARYVDREGHLLAALAGNSSAVLGSLRRELAA